MPVNNRKIAKEILRIARAIAADQYYHVEDTSMAIYNKWKVIEVGHAQPTPDQKEMIASALKARRAGKSYTDDVYNAVVQDMGGRINPADIGRQPAKGARMERGLLGYEIYYATNVADHTFNREGLQKHGIESGRTYKEIHSRGMFFPVVYVKVHVETITPEGHLIGIGMMPKKRGKFRIDLLGRSILKVVP